MTTKKAKPTHAVSTVVVEGRFSFPIDMLRYDSCVPATGADASIVCGHATALTRVTLRRFYQPDGERMPTSERWASFGWLVVSVDGVTVMSYVEAKAEEKRRDTPPELNAEEKRLATSGDFIAAIRAVRARLNVSLMAAKTSVDKARGF